MCNSTQLINLTETETGRISWCKDCRNYSLVFKTTCASFTEPELFQFVKILDNLGENSYQYHHFNERRVILRSTQTQIGFCLSKEEVAQLQELIKEALAVSEAFKIIYA